VDNLQAQESFEVAIASSQAVGIPYVILGDFIDKHFSYREQLIAEALGKIFWERSKKICDIVKIARAKDPHCPITTDEKYDGTKYGLDYYKYLGYKFVFDAKNLNQSMAVGRTKDQMLTWEELLQIIHGDQIEYAVGSPRSFS
jgi:hypothetical protein